MSRRATAAAVLAFMAAVSTFAVQPGLPEARAQHGAGLADKKGPPAADDRAESALLTTLDQVHTGEHVALDAVWPTQARFDELLSDRVTGAKHALDGRLLGLLRSLAAKYPGGRIELVSGFRSPKLNEMLRKKGHHVSAHSQHSLGNACDFRLFPAGEASALDPRAVEGEIRGLGWEGGVGVYPTKEDWFVHADVGPRRHWVN